MPKKKKEEPNTTISNIEEINPKVLAIQELIQKGYDAYYDDGIVMCKWRDDNTFTEIRQILNGIGYNASFGVVADNTTEKKEVKQMGGRPEDARLKELRDKGETIYSISRIDTINNCLQCAYRTYILKEKDKPNVYASAGSVIHEILENITNGKATEKDLLPGVRMELENLEALGIEFPKTSSGEDTIKANWVANMEHFCKTYIAPKNKKLTTEQLFIYTTPNGHYLQGYIDLQMTNKDGSISLFDYKSSTLYSTEEMKKHARQLILYALGKEQEGYKVKSASFIFLKYATVTFMGKKTKKSKEKTKIVKNIERRKLGQELSGYVYADLIEQGMDDFDAQIILDKFKNENIIEGVLPKSVSDNYKLTPYVVSVDLSETNKNECIKYIEDTIDLWEKLDPDNESEYPPKSFTKINKSGKEVPDTYFCTALCDHGDKCPYLHDFLDSYNNEEDDDLF